MEYCDRNTAIWPSWYAVLALCAYADAGPILNRRYLLPRWVLETVQQTSRGCWVQYGDAGRLFGTESDHHTKLEIG